MMPVEFEKAWSDLNMRLRELETASGLTAALYALETHQRESGFIADGLQQLERHTFRHPHDRSRTMRVQYNPRRALRFKGAGEKKAPPSDHNDGCLLCRANIEWQQSGTQLGYRVESGSRAYFALMNPFPLLPTHVVLAAREHRGQNWTFANGGGFGITTLIEDLVGIGARMPGHIGFYNGVSAGASIPGHLHFQFMMRPDEDRVFPLEAAAFRGDARGDGPAFATHYPVDVALWKGRPEEVVTRACDWIVRWGARNHARLTCLSGNLIVSREIDDGEVSLYFIPRDRARSGLEGFSGLAGGLEMLGEVVLSSPEEKARLDGGQIDYFVLEKALAEVHTPLEVD